MTLNINSFVFFLSSRCIPLTKENLEEYVYSGCHPFMTQQCYLLNYTVDYKMLIFNATQRSIFLTGSYLAFPECHELVIALLCARAYPDCNPLTQLPIGLCPHECVKYIQQGFSKQSFANMAQKLTESRISNTPFRDLSCDNPLIFIQNLDQSFVNHSVDSRCLTFSCKFY